MNQPDTVGENIDSAEKRRRKFVLNPFLCKSDGMRRLSILLSLALLVAWITLIWVDTGGFQRIDSSGWVIALATPFGAYLSVMTSRLLVIWVVTGEIQKLVLVVVIVIFVAMFLYPPFHAINDDGVVVNMGYGWLMNPPEDKNYDPATVNIAMLLTQWLGVLVVGGLAYLLSKSNSSRMS